MSQTPNDPTIETHGFRVDSPCGRSYEVPLAKVRDDYARFLMENDGVTRAEALEKCDRDTLETWFCEQFDWSDVERYGRVVKNPSARQIKEALDLMRASDVVSSVAKVVALPEKVAQQKGRRLEKALSTPEAPSPSRRPRM